MIEERGLNGLAQEIHRNAQRHDWWKPRSYSDSFSGESFDVPRELPEVLMLIHSEVSEAGEEWRNGREPDEIYWNHDGRPCDLGETCSVVDRKPQGIPIELADVVIRVLDACAYFGVDIQTAVRVKMEYNETRPVNHGRRI